MCTLGLKSRWGLIFSKAVFWVFLFLCIATESIASQSIVVDVTVNSVKKGAFFAVLADDGDFLLRKRDLESIGIEKPTGKTVNMDGTQYLSLKSIKGITFHFDEKTLTLEINAVPSLLPVQEMSLLSGEQPKAINTRDTSVFLNYGLDYDLGNSLDFQSFSLTNQLGARYGDFLFLTDSIYRKSGFENRFIRLMSSVIRDSRDNMSRLTFGDFFASSGDLGSTLNMGGVSYSKVYGINPYFIYQPMLNIRGALALPSDVEVYLDGMRLEKEKFQPGEFDLKNLNYYGGRHVVELVIRDSFGRQQRLRYPFYFTDRLLRKGLHEYSYNIGPLRQDYGMESDSYGTLAFSAFHRYGLSDSMTIGMRTEGAGEIQNFGGEADFRLGQSGILLAEISSSRNGAHPGMAGSVDYEYQDTHFSGNLLARAFTDEYSRAGDTVFPGIKPKYNFAAGIGYGDKKMGNVSVDYSATENFTGEDIKTLSFSYIKNLRKNLNFIGTYRNGTDNGNINEVFFGLNYYFGKDSSITGGIRAGKDGNSETLQIQKNLPVGEGYGYRATVERDENKSSGMSYEFDPSVQVNTKYATVIAERYGQYGNGTLNGTYRLFVAGGVAYVGDAVGASRSIDDSFGLVKVGDIKGVAVSVNNQEIGKTNSRGEVFAPDLSSYNVNQITINQKDVPLNYTLGSVTQYISPPLRGGAFISFDAQKFQAVTGSIKVRVDGKIKPVEFEDVNVDMNGKEITFPTGKNGEFYIENIKPGRFRASVAYLKSRCDFEIIVPVSGEVIVNIGDVICEPAH